MKKIMKLLGCFILLLSVIFLIKKSGFYYTSYSNNTSISITGDVNMDGIINEADYGLVSKYIMKIINLSNMQFKLADMNKDNRVSSLDYILIRKAIESGQVRPTPTPTSTPDPNIYTINYHGNGETGGTISSHVCKINEKCAIKANEFTKDNYYFVGWTTNSQGIDDGNGWTNWSGTWKCKNGEYGVINNELNLYAIWSNYDITKDTARLSSFRVQNEYNSSTLRYKILKNSTEEHSIYVVIWVNDANKQINAAVPNSRQDIGSIMTNEINKMGYQNKGMIITNASFMQDNRPAIPIVMSHGNVIYNNGYNLKPYHSIGIDASGNIVWMDRDKVTLDELKNAGIQNTWAGNFCRKGSEIQKAEEPTWVNEFGQIDNHNFVIHIGYMGLGDAQVKLVSYFGAKSVCNMDGGGSVRLSYKTSQSKIQKVFAAPTDPNRTLSDALYFVEQ